MKKDFISNFRNYLVIDIETASAFPHYKDMDDRLQKLWDKKASFIRSEEKQTPEELYFERGAIYAEFGKVICIAVGIFTKEPDDTFGLRIKSFANADERELLLEFRELVLSKFRQDDLRLVAHNGREFDFPYLCRRMLVNDIELPPSLDVRNKKPWEIHHIDTMELWKFGDRKNFTSLELLATLFGVDSSKDDIDGSQVNKVYYENHDLARIAEYCRRDVQVTASVFLKLIGMDILNQGDITYL